MDWIAILNQHLKYFKIETFYNHGLISTLEQLWEIIIAIGLGCNNDFKCFYLTHGAQVDRGVNCYNQCYFTNIKVSITMQ
jgi:hypothetical protein